MENERGVELEVVGRHALLFDDDSTAVFVNSADALVPWSGGGDSSLVIDRFDARHLLQKIPRRLNSDDNRENLVEPDGFTRADLDAERYRELGFREDGGNREEDSKENVQQGGSYRTVPFSYSSYHDSKSQKEGLESSSYRPSFHLPDHLLSSLPPTEKVHQIISRTAKFVSEHGGQTEIILRVKQGGNPTFGFLMPDDKLHPYFRYLVEHPEHCKTAADVAGQLAKEKTPDPLDNKSQISGGALSLLGSVYGTGEEDGILDKPKAREKVAGNYTTPSSVKSTNMDSSLFIVKENPLLPSKSSSSSIVVPSGAAKGRLKDTSSSSTNPLASKTVQESSAVALPVVEPSSSLKRMVEKTVEFISRNGREFETSLILQDKTNEKFPFLRPTNLYHSYYLKILHQTLEGSLPGKNVSDDSSPESRTEQKSKETPLEVERKEKFKINLGGGGSRKDGAASPPKSSKPPGLSSEEVAAIVMGATRGLARSQSPAYAPKISSFHIPDAIRRAVEDQGATCSSPVIDEQQKLKAERLKRAKEFAAMIQSRKQKPIESPPAVTEREDSASSFAKPKREKESDREHRSHRRRHREDQAIHERRQRRHHSSTSSKRQHADEERASSLDGGKAGEKTEAKTSAQPTEIPDDLRAKIRAMLQATR